MIKEVLLIFKTHLDIGFTDYAAPVTEKYLHQYLPAAIRTAREQENTPYPFVWTTGTWLIEKALKEDDGTLEAAIRDGLIRWHALPFTMHTEYMNEELLEYGLDICARLDARFGKKTVSAKMTDVPGHTAGLIRHLAARGIEFLHIGVNTATPAPNVPPVFRWKWGDDSIAVIYNKDYGEICEVGDTAVAFGFTGDNLGPQGGDQLKAVYDELQEKYPGAKNPRGVAGRRGTDPPRCGAARDRGGDRRQLDPRHGHRSDENPRLPRPAPQRQKALRLRSHGESAPRARAYLGHRSEGLLP